MDKYLNSFREMISLRGLTDHTMISYCTYIHAYLAYLSDVLHKEPVYLDLLEQLQDTQAVYESEVRPDTPEQTISILYRSKN